VLHPEQNAEDVRVERRGEGFRRLVGNWSDLAFGAGIVHRDIETAESGDDLVDQGADVVLRTDVGIDEPGFRRARAVPRPASCLPHRAGRPVTTAVAPFRAKATSPARPMPERPR
jgi:hypothetical protein